MQSERQTLGCACVDSDPTVCYDLRIYGYSPAIRETDEWHEVCSCACHEKDDGEA